MKKRHLINKLLFAVLLVAALSCTGCKKADNDSVKTEAKEDSKDEITPADSKEEDADTDSKKEDAAPEETGTKKTMAEIEELAEKNVYQVNWYTTEGSFMAGTAFIMPSDATKHDTKLLVTAFHYLCPDDKDSITGEELPEYVTGGVVCEAKSGHTTLATLKNCMVIEDAQAAPAFSKDVAAFSMSDTDVVHNLPISTHKLSKGDTVYLLANLWDTDDIHENCVYEGTVISDKNGVLTYDMDEKYGTKGASGAPIVNEYGEVVAIHLGSNGSTRYAHSADSFIDQINNGTLSEIEYPSDFSNVSTQQPAENQKEVYELTREDIMMAYCYDITLNSIQFTDKLGNAEAPKGYTYMVIDVAVDGAEKFPGSIDFYEDDIYVKCDKPEDPDDDLREELLPLMDDLVENQFKDSVEIKAGVSASGKMVYYIPKETKTVDLIYRDYIGFEDNSEIDNLYVMTVPVEDWSR